MQYLYHGVLLYDLSVQVLDPALHVQTAAVSHEDLLFFFLDTCLHRSVVAAAGGMADDGRGRVSGQVRK